MAMKRSRSFSFAPRKRFRRSGRFNKRFKRRPLAPRRTGGFFSTRVNSIGAEKKAIDYRGVPSGSSASIQPYVLNAVGAGSDFNQRIGRRIRMKSLLFRVLVSFPVTEATSETAQFRLLIVLDKQYNASATTTTTTNAPLVNAGLIDNTQVIAADWINAPINLNNRDRFKVLVDKFVDLNQEGPAMKHIHIYKKMNIDTTFGNTGATGGDIQTNAVLCYMFTNNANTASTITDITYYSRIRFIDM